MAVYLQTERLTLREFTSGDVDNAVALDSDAEVMFYINGGHPTPVEQVRDDILPYWLAFYDRPGNVGYWAVEERATGRFIGWFHLRPGRSRPVEDGLELGYRFRKEAWGQGFASEGARALVDKAFTDLGAERVYANALAVHGASRRVMEKAGLRYERTFHADWPEKIPGDEHGDVEYALSRDQWRNS